MAASKTHKDVEFVVLGHGGKEQHFKRFDEAAAFAFIQALQDGTWRNLSVLIWSEAGARWWGGDDAVEQYREDPDASVFQQLAVKVDDRGMIA